MNCGVYTITTPSGGQYVGSSCNITRRWKNHKICLRSGKHKNSILLRAYRKYNDALRFAVIIVCEKADLIMYEQIAIDALHPRYNIAPTAGSTLGRKHTEETCAKISVANRGQRRSEETCAKISAANKGRRRSEETRAKLRASHLGKKYGPISEETRTKISATKRARFQVRKLNSAASSAAQAASLLAESITNTSAPARPASTKHP